MGRLSARLAQTEADRELGRHVAEAQRSLQRAVEVCTRVAMMGERRPRAQRDGSPAEVRRAERLQRKAAIESNGKKAEALQYQAEQKRRRPPMYYSSNSCNFYLMWFVN